jgi:phage gp16-like protein
MAEASTTVRVAKLKLGGNWALWSAHARAYLLKFDVQEYLSKMMLRSDED